jgi:hypothetical protein
MNLIKWDPFRELELVVLTLLANFSHKESRIRSPIRGTQITNFNREKWAYRDRGKYSVLLATTRQQRP